jgi:hypothetical protein
LPFLPFPLRILKLSFKIFSRSLPTKVFVPSSTVIGLSVFSFIVKHDGLVKSLSICHSCPDLHRDKLQQESSRRPIGPMARREVFEFIGFPFSCLRALPSPKRLRAGRCSATARKHGNDDNGLNRTFLRVYHLKYEKRS